MSFGQARDSFFYENTEYTLQAISEGKHLINCADFHLDIEVQFNPSTNNRKGYIGRYFVENNMLYGIKRVYLYSEEVNSEKIFLDFTGGCIIVAPDPGVQCRYFQYLYCDVAYELIFEKGNLVGVNDLSKAIKIINTSSRVQMSIYKCRFLKFFSCRKTYIFIFDSQLSECVKNPNYPQPYTASDPSICMKVR